MKMKHIAAALALMAMPFAAQAEVQDAMRVDGFGMRLIYPAVHTGNMVTEDAINKDIKGYVRQMEDLYENGERQDVYMTYTKKYEDENLVSLVIKTEVTKAGTADSNSQAHGLVYDKKAGALVDKSKFGVDADNKKIVNELKSKKLKLYNINGKMLSYDRSFIPTAMAQTEYFLLDKDTLALLYAPGELAPYSDGATYVVIDLK